MQFTTWILTMSVYVRPSKKQKVSFVINKMILNCCSFVITGKSPNSATIGAKCKERNANHNAISAIY